MRRILLVILAAATITVGAGWYAAARLPGWLESPETAAAPVAPAQPEQGERKIRATLFYVSEDGLRLVGVPSEVPFAERAADQARRVLEAELGPAPPPYAQALPAGTVVRAVFLTDRKEAFVDLSSDVSKAHSGGSLDEIFTVYAIVNALTVNLPAIERVQILIEGHEVDSLAGHVDLRQPLSQNLGWVADSTAESDDAETSPTSSNVPPTDDGGLSVP